MTWWENGKRREREIRLDWQGDPKRLDDLYWTCETGRHERQQPAPPKHCWGNLIDAWRVDPRGAQKLKPGSLKKVLPFTDRIKLKNGHKHVRKTTRAGLRAIHLDLSETPRQADRYIQTVSMLWNFATDKLDWDIGKNPAARFELFGKQKEWLPWPNWLVRQLESAPFEVRCAAELILGTGQRPGAAIAMRWDHFDGEWMSVLDEKQNERFEAYCPADLRQFLAQAPRSGAHVLAANLTEPMGYDAIYKKFAAWRDDLGDEAKPYVLHGLRKLSITRLAEAGCSDAQIQAVTNQSIETVAYYRKRANRKLLTRAAQEKRT